MKILFLYAMAAGYFIAGIFHFTHPAAYKKIMPPWLPYHLALIYLSGACESIFGLMLLPESSQPFAAWLIIAMLVAIFPANVQMFIDIRKKWKKRRREIPEIREMGGIQKPVISVPYTSIPIISFWLFLTAARLPLQIVLIWWAWLYTK